MIPNSKIMLLNELIFTRSRHVAKTRKINDRVYDVGGGDLSIARSTGSLFLSSVTICYSKLTINTQSIRLQ